MELGESFRRFLLLEFITLENFKLLQLIAFAPFHPTAPFYHKYGKTLVSPVTVLIYLNTVFERLREQILH